MSTLSRCLGTQVWGWVVLGSHGGGWVHLLTFNSCFLIHFFPIFLFFFFFLFKCRETCFTPTNRWEGTVLPHNSLNPCQPICQKPYPEKFGVVSAANFRRQAFLNIAKTNALETSLAAEDLETWCPGIPSLKPKPAFPVISWAPAPGICP